jgi:hypothetical protein
MPETGHATKKDLIDETRELVSRLVEVKHKLKERECEFVLSMDEKLRTYGYGAFVSAKQLFWLRDLEERLVPDERQTGLFESQ